MLFTTHKLTKPKKKKKMDNRFSLFLISALLLISATTSLPDNSDDAIIRQVVDAGAGVGETLSDDPLLGAEHHFTLFKKKYGKSYANQEEHAFRFKVFQKNLKRARRHQRMDPSAIHGVTQFSDLTRSEFKRTVLGLRGSRRLRLPTDAHTAPILPTEGLPEDFDWRDHGAVTEVKNQVSFFLFLF